MRKVSEERQIHPEAESFQQRLLDYVEMVYSVAFGLTGSSCDAERLTRSTMSRIWQRQNTLAQELDLKAELLCQLRKAFLDKQRIDLRIKTRWGGDPHGTDRPLASEAEASRERLEKKEDSILVVAF